MLSRWQTAEREQALAPGEKEVVVLAAHVQAGIARWLDALGAWELEGAWGGPGMHSFAQWVSWRCGVSRAEAREYVRVARRLRELPAIRDAFLRAEIGYAKVRSLTRVADLRCEEELVELAAVLTTSQLDRVLKAYRDVTREQALEAQEGAFLDLFWDADGTLVLRGRLPAEDGAVLVRALDRAREAIRARRRSSAPDPGDGPATPAPTKADALVAVADAALASLGGERSGGDRYQVVVHVDADALADDETAGRCHLEDGPAVARETARRVACDASVVRLLERDGEPLSVGRKTRAVPPALRRALRARDGGCQFPGCDNSRFVDAHHVRHWARGGETRLDNLVLLCRTHHRLVHEGGYAVDRRRDGEVRFYDARGRSVPAAPQRPTVHPDDLVRRNRREGLEIDAETCQNGLGERMELWYVADCVKQIIEQRE